MRNLLKIALTVLASVVLTLVVLEVMLPLFVDVTDPIQYSHIDGVGMCLEPHQSGTYLADPLQGGPQIRGRFSVNNVGYNSWRDYRTSLHPGTHRIAVVGDSFVEALQVDINDSFPAVLEKRLNNQGVDVEVLSFGVSGFGTAQVLSLIENLVLDYSPDLIIYLFVPNDVEDSSPWMGRDPWNPQYDLNAEDEIVALPYEPYVIPFGKSFLKRSAIFRYLFFQKHWAARLRRLQGSSKWSIPSTGQPVDDAEQRAWRIVEQLLVKIDTVLDGASVPWVLVWQADTDPAYFEDRRIRLEEIAARHRLPLLDPSPAFARDYEEQREVHHIVGDGHWNEHGHRVMGSILADWWVKRFQSGDSDEKAPEPHK